MATIRSLAIVTLVALVAAIIVLSLDPAFAQDALRTLPSPKPLPGTTRGAPGPIAGTGLVTALIGGAGYWLFRRFRKTS